MKRPVIAFALLCCNSACMAAKYEIDWTRCEQPDLSAPAFLEQVEKLYKPLVAAAAAAAPNAHVSVQLNRQYPKAVAQRRKLVADSYLPKEMRDASGCATTKKNYMKILALRDAAYRLLCRGEVAVGLSKESRNRNEIKVRAFTEVYEALKSIKANVAASDDPTTPPGGAASCVRGIEEGQKDPLPSSEAAIAGFDSHMSACDALSTLSNSLSPELKKKAKESGVCLKEGG